MSGLNDGGIRRPGEDVDAVRRRLRSVTLSCRDAAEGPLEDVCRK